MGLQHTATNKEYCGCAFTQKVLNMCKMLKSMGHSVIHYGNEGSNVECDEDVVILSKDEILPPSHIHKFDSNGENYKKFNNIVTVEIAKRKQPRDFLLCPWVCHQVIADQHKDLIVVESGIGYAAGFAPFKVFESYALMHAYYGYPAVTVADKLQWYSHVIPNYFDPADFRYDYKKDDYVLFLGMRHGGVGKGYSVAADAARDAGIKMICAGHEAPSHKHDNIEYIGLIGVEERARLLSKARAVMCPSLYLEPFCGVQVEAYLSGTPCISTDWGAFVEYNKHGVTGYRCKTHKQFVQAIEDCKNIDPEDCRYWGERFTLDRVKHEYEEYWCELMKIYTGQGWYEMGTWDNPIPRATAAK